jgi:NTP pyrophosphatase (non-canonical NTP hydrolase)
MSNMGLTKLMEECGEVIQVAAKIIAYPDGVHPDGGGRLETRLEDELGDLLAIITFVTNKLKLSDHDIQSRANSKFNNFLDWDKRE